MKKVYLLLKANKGVKEEREKMYACEAKGGRKEVESVLKVKQGARATNDAAPFYTFSIDPLRVERAS